MKYFIPIEMVWNSYCWNFSMVIQMKHFFFALRYMRYIELALIISIETSKNLTQLLSTSNKSSSSGEMKITWRGLVYIGERDLTPLVINDELWRLIFTPLKTLALQALVDCLNLMKLGLSDLILHNLYPGSQPGPVGLRPYRTELFATKFKSQTLGQLFST